jgi:hypothetical protein
MYDELNPKDENSTFVPVVFAHDNKEADFYQSLLEDHGITVQINEDYANDQADSDEFSGLAGGIAILVESDDLTEAEEVIKTRMEDDDLDDEDENNFYSDHDDDNFDGMQEFDPDKDGH